MKKRTLYITLLVLSVAAYLVFEWAKPKPINWTESYSGTDKIPYGTYIMRDLLPDLFPGESISYQSQPIFDLASTTEVKNVIFINNRFTPDEFEAEKLLEKVDKGKNIFIAAKRFGGKLADTLGIETKSLIAVNELNSEEKIDSLHSSPSDDPLRQNYAWLFKKKMDKYNFASFDTTRSKILGTDGSGNVNYIKISIGEGAFYVYTVPRLFTNYFMRKQEKAEYAFKILSHLPVAPTAWDEYYKAGRSTARSPLRYVVSHPYLKWAWITALAGLCLFIVFRAKRRERIIPEISRPENTTLEFTRTIGQLYHQSSSHKNLAEKKITYFLKYIRDELNLDTQNINDSFITKVAQRSGVDTETSASLFQYISKVQNWNKLSSEELWELNEKIETFYRKSTR